MSFFLILALLWIIYIAAHADPRSTPLHKRLPLCVSPHMAWGTAAKEMAR